MARYSEIYKNQFTEHTRKKTGNRLVPGHSACTVGDLGIRHYNKKTGEVRMIGKYLGALLPIVFGFYGLMGLYGEYAPSSALNYVGQMAVVLYPPFLVFAIMHYRYIQIKEGLLLKKLKASPHQMMQNDKETVILNDR